MCRQVSDHGLRLTSVQPWGGLLAEGGGYFCDVASPTQQLAPAQDIDARLTEIERSLNLLLNVTSLRDLPTSRSQRTLSNGRPPRGP